MAVGPSRTIQLPIELHATAGGKTINNPTPVSCRVRFFLIGAVSIWGIAAGLVAWQLLADSRYTGSTSGKVVKMYIERSKYGGIGSCTVEYEYSVNAQLYKQAMRLAATTCKTLTRGGPITVRFVPEEPWRSRIDTIHIFVVEVVLILFFGALALLLYGLRYPYK